jgi:hypothetical protein
MDSAPAQALTGVTFFDGLGGEDEQQQMKSRNGMMGGPVITRPA